MLASPKKIVSAWYSGFCSKPGCQNKTYNDPNEWTYVCHSSNPFCEVHDIEARSFYFTYKALNKKIIANGFTNDKDIEEVITLRTNYANIFLGGSDKCHDNYIDILKKVKEAKVNKRTDLHEQLTRNI